MDSVVLLPTTGSQINLTGEKQKGAGYSNWSGTSHTVSVTCTNFVGRIYLEASLATDPVESDWFGIPFNGTLTYVQYPLNPFRPTGVLQGDTGTSSFEFVGNYVWVRARLDRTYLNPQPIDTLTVGGVDQALMNYGALGGIASGGGTWGIQGPTGARGPMGLQGAPGVPGLGVIKEFTISYNSMGQVNGVTNLPAGWSATFTNDSVTVTHNQSSLPSGFYVWGLNSLLTTTWSVRGPDLTMYVSYDSTQPTQFQLVNVIATNVGTVANGAARAILIFA